MHSGWCGKDCPGKKQCNLVLGIMQNICSKFILWIHANRWLLAILLVNLVLRLVFVSFFSNWDEGDMMDSSRYQRVALNIIRRCGFAEWTSPTAFSPPLYPFFMAGIMKLFGTSSVPIKIVQILLSVLTGAAVYLIGKTVFNRPTGLIASLWIAVNPELIVLAGTLYTETLYIFISCLVFTVLVYAIQHPGKQTLWIGAGVLMGLAILTRHILILFPLLLLVFVLFFSSTRPLWKPFLLFALVSYLLLVPWIVRHYVVFDQFVPVASGAGGGLWHGSTPSNNGTYQYDISRKQVARETRGLERPVDKDRLLLRKSLQAIGKSPLKFIVQVGQKYLRFFTQVYEDVPQGERRKKNPLVLTMLVLNYYPVLLACLFGWVVYFKKWPRLFPLYWVIIYSGLIYSITLVTPRYRIPLLPFMILFASAGLFHGIQQWSGRIRGSRNPVPQHEGNAS